MYDMQTNAFRTWNASTDYPWRPKGTLTFTTGTSSVVVAGNHPDGVASVLLLQHTNTGRWYQLDFSKQRLFPFSTNNIQANSTAYTGNKACGMRSPDGLEFLYAGQSNTTTLSRCPVWLP